VVQPLDLAKGAGLMVQVHIACLPTDGPDPELRLIAPAVRGAALPERVRVILAAPDVMPWLESHEPSGEVIAGAFVLLLSDPCPARVARA
jgi:hypothetical protein